MPDADTATRSVGYNARAFTIDGQPEILLSAGIHYFRVPRELWADRIARAKRGGMNTIETYVAWNFHEIEPGVVVWDGDHDLDAFLTECERQGMYVIARPGPYICAEWDYGGFPAWLQTLPGVAFRTMNRPYLDAVDRWFDALLPVIERHQWTRGGGVILVQVENEYANLKWTRGEDMAVDDAYQHYVRDGLIRRGIDVPLITCAGWCDGTIEGVNGHDPAEQMPDFRHRFPHNPLFATEFWTGWYDAWGQPHHTRSAQEVEYASLRCWAEGACGYNHYVYHGGTNFGYTAMYRQTTSYDYDAPVSETGRLTDKWRASRRVALWATTFKEVLLSGEHRRGVRATGGLRVTETATRENGSILFVDNPDAEKTATGSVFPYLPEVTLGPRDLFPYVHDFPIGATGRYLYAYVGLVKSDAPVLTAHILTDPYDGARVYVYGTPGETCEVALFNGNDRGRGVQVTFAETPQIYPVGPSQVIALSTEMAGRVWIHPNDENTPVLIGPDDVRDHGPEDAVVEVASDRAHTLYSLRPDGSLTEINVEAPPLPSPPALSAWETIAEPDYAEPDFDDSDWRELDDVATQGNMIALNIAQNGPAHGSNPYGWYRARIHMDEACDAQLHFAACSDRLTLFVNGERVGSSPVPPEDRRGDWTVTFDLRLNAGENVLCVLADNLGLIKGDWQIGKGQEQEKKGIYGPVTLTPTGGCYLIDVARWRFRGLLHGERAEWFASSPSPTAWERGPGSEGSPIRWHRATFMLDPVPGSATPLLARLDGMGKGLAWLNGRSLGRYWQTAGPQRDYYLPEPWLRAGENTLVLAETEGNTPESVALVWDANSAAVVRVLL